MDSRNPKVTAWQILHAYDCSKDSSLLKRLQSAANLLIGYSVEESILSEYDKLVIVEFKKVFIFL